MKRLVLDIGIFTLILAMFLSGVHTHLPAALQTAALKSLLVSAGFMAAHITGKLAFPKVDWQAPWLPAHAVRIALYVVVIYAYAIGG